jgi:hypothetical protein
VTCPGTGPCGAWDLDLACLDPGGDLPGPCSDGVPVSDEILAAATLSASQILWALTGRQFGTCDVVVRPCRLVCLDEAFPLSWQGAYPVLYGGQWFNLACGCGNRCSCTDLCEVLLPYPVCEVIEVLVDGTPVDPGAYRVDDFRSLVRTDGECWPRCQDMARSDTEAGTWSVALTYGREVPQLVLDAASEIACEFIRARLGQACRLPQRIASLTRQGVSMSFVDPQGFWTEGRTGFYLTDLAIRTFNPRMLQRNASVYSVDAPAWRVPPWSVTSP